MMMELVAAAALAASAESASPTQVSPVVVNPPPIVRKQLPPAATVVVAADESASGAFASVWPEGAYGARISGEVTLSCDIDIHGPGGVVPGGLPESCQRGKGFGWQPWSCGPRSN